MAVPGNGNRMSASKKVRSFDCGQRSPMTNLLEVDSSSATTLTMEYHKEVNLEIGNPHASTGPRFVLKLANHVLPVARPIKICFQLRKFTKRVEI